MTRSSLFDEYDPYGLLQQQADMGMLPSDDPYDPYARRKARISDLMGEEEKTGLLRSLSQAGSSGLAAAGWLFDTPGAFVRGLLSGGPGKAASSLWENSEDRVSGRDLLRQYGMVGKEDTWGNFGGGLAAEVLLDPTTYATLGLSAVLGKGAKTAAGKAAERAGLLRNVALDAADDGVGGVRQFMRTRTPQNMLDRIADPMARAEAERTLRHQFNRLGVGDDAMNQVMGSFDEIRLPFTQQGINYDLGPLGEHVARLGDQFSAWTRNAPGVGHARTWLSSAFEKGAGDFWNPDLELTNRIQDASRRRYRNADDLLYATRLQDTSLERAARDAQVPTHTTAGDEIPAEFRSFDSRQLKQAMADWVESRGPILPSGRPLNPNPTSGNEFADWVMENVPELRAVRNSFADLGADAAAAAREAGLPSPQWNSTQGTGWFPRQLHWWRNNELAPGAEARTRAGWGRAERVLTAADNFGRQRSPWTDIPGGMRTFRDLTGNVHPDVDSQVLQQALIATRNEAVRPIIDDAFNRMGLGDPYQAFIDRVTASQPYRDALASGDTARAQAMVDRVEREIAGHYVSLADSLRSADTQFARNNRGIFDSDPWHNYTRYRQGQALNQASAQELIRQIDQFAQATPAGAVPGGLNQSLMDTATGLGLDDQAFREVWERLRPGTSPEDFSVARRHADALASLSPKTRLAPTENALLNAADQFHSVWKAGALASPAFHTRNAYSGAVNAATHGAFNPLDFWANFRASSGNMDALAARLENAPGFEGMSPAERVARYQNLTGATQVTGSTVLDDAVGALESPGRGSYIGADPTSVAAQAGAAAYQPGRTWGGFLNDFFSARGVGITQNRMTENTNPLLVLNDAVGKRVEDSLRGGVFLNQLRQGIDPRRAADVSFLSNVDYRPEAFTSFERGLKRFVPFYSFQRGILPSIATNVVERPGGLQNQLIRAASVGSRPSEDNFVPEHLRKSSAIPLPHDLPSILGGSGNPALKRYLTNIDMPWESFFNLFTPGIGATTASAIGDAIAKTGSNLLGMTTPLLKAPLEYATNRQLYSGRELSDLYSVLEQDIGPMGRPLEQAIVNFLPGGSRALGLYRQATDERMSTGEALQKAAFNLLGFGRLTDVDEKRARRLAARDMLNSILETTPGVKTYENITVPESALQNLTEEQRRLYLLYRTIQSDAAKQARDRKKAAMDPLELLGAG